MLQKWIICLSLFAVCSQVCHLHYVLRIWWGDTLTTFQFKIICDFLIPYFTLDPEIGTLFRPTKLIMLHLQAISSEGRKFPSSGAITADGKSSVLAEVFTGTETGDSFTKRETAADEDASPGQKKKAKGPKKTKIIPSVGLFG